VASVAAIQADLGAVPAQDVIFTAMLTVDGALVTYGPTWMARTVRQLRAVRLELAQVAVAQERLRFAQDVHDLLGPSLSAITLKCDLAAGCCRDPVRARTVLATVLREAVTNVLRHSKDKRCEITIRNDQGGVRLRIVNDGVTEPAAGGQWGSGIRNLSGRVAALGGVLTTGFEHDGRFELCARVQRPCAGPPVTARSSARPNRPAQGTGQDGRARRVSCGPRLPGRRCPPR
jgi:signal transduction histidine kinase